MVFIGGRVLFAIASFLDWSSFGSVFGVGLPGASANGFDTGFLWCAPRFIEFYDRSVGIYLGLVAALVATFGGFLVYTESGGTIDDLKKIDKLRASLHHAGNGDASPPPLPSAPPPPVG